MARRMELLVLLGVLAVSAAVHAPSLDLAFKSDDFGIVEQVHRLGPGQALWQALARRYLDWALAFYRPTASALFVPQVAAFGPHPTGYHVVSLVLLLATGALLAGILRRLLPERRLVAPAFAALYLLLPCHAEPLAWTIAGQQEQAAACFCALTMSLLLRASWWCLPAALLAFGSKESALGLAVMAPTLACALPATSARGRIMKRALLVTLSGVLFFGLRTLVIGGFELPYQQAAGPGFMERALNGVAHFAPAWLTALGPAPGLLLGLALIVGLGGWKRDGSERVAGSLRKRLVLVAGLLAFSAPLLTLDLEHVQPSADARAFVPAALMACVVAGASCGRFARQVLLVPVLAAAATWSAVGLPGVYEDFRVVSDRVERTIARIREAPGERLLVSGLPGALQWAYPAAALPPFRDPPRSVFPLRAQTRTEMDVLPIRPLGDAAAVLVLGGDDAIHVEEAARATNEGPLRFKRTGPGSLTLVDNPPPERLPSLLATPARPGTQVSVRVIYTLIAGGPRRQRTITSPAPTADPVVLPLVDLPGWPRARYERITLRGVRRARRGPPLSGALQIVDPAPGSLLTTADAARPFRIEGLPAEAGALRITLFTPAGAAFPVTIPRRSFSFAALVDAGQPHFWYALSLGLKLGTDEVYLMIEALADAARPGSLLDRAPLARYRIRLE